MAGAIIIPCVTFDDTLRFFYIGRFMQGWIKTHRSITEWEWYKKPFMFHLFSHLLLKANHSDKRWQGIEVKRGQLITSRKSLSFQTGIPEQTTRTCLNRLKSTNELTIRSTKHYSLITIVNFELYQSKEKNQPTDQPTDAPAINQQPTNDQPTTNQRLTTNKNEKNYKNVENEDKNKEAFDIFWKYYPRKIEKIKSEAFVLFQEIINNKKCSSAELIKASKNYKYDYDKDVIDKTYANGPVKFLKGGLYIEYMKKDSEEQRLEKAVKRSREKIANRKMQDKAIRCLLEKKGKCDTKNEFDYCGKCQVTISRKIEEKERGKYE